MLVKIVLVTFLFYNEKNAQLLLDVDDLLFSNHVSM